MLAVCNGNRNSAGRCKNLTCDARRGNKPLKVNPCDSHTLIGIHYKADGTIYSDDKIIDEDLNERLNLNSPSISFPQNRKAALDGLIKQGQAARGSHGIKSFCLNTLEKIETAEKKPPYAGIMIDWLKRHI